MGVPMLTAVAWPSANGPRHIGHVSGFGVPADVFSRYQRMVGNRVLMVCGTDEHGTRAEPSGLLPAGSGALVRRADVLVGVLLTGGTPAKWLASKAANATAGSCATGTGTDAE